MPALVDVSARLVVAARLELGGAGTQLWPVAVAASVVTVAEVTVVAATVLEPVIPADVATISATIVPVAVAEAIVAAVPAPFVAPVIAATVLEPVIAAETSAIVAAVVPPTVLEPVIPADVAAVSPAIVPVAVAETIVAAVPAPLVAPTILGTVVRALPAAAVVGGIAAAGTLVVTRPVLAGPIGLAVVRRGLGGLVAELERAALLAVQRVLRVGVVVAAAGGLGALCLPLFSGPARLFAWFHHEESSR
ncbi:MAG: hypothetical protein IPJ61_12125 [Tessaracoccus sp.]|uniref:hypothetical protein n=1 Tax=Tessaracoccus sp. TaxID=1971211 RepID=UPI001EC1EA6D|nr:hypothetical protein [Tessaracoccus sp.]MBK7821789.1 hypothetical protein [Tessaracoccus sp.]